MGSRRYKFCGLWADVTVLGFCYPGNDLVGWASVSLKCRSPISVVLLLLGSTGKLVFW